MNYKKIAKFIKDSKHLTIWNNGREQWIGNGMAMFPVVGMPFMKEKEILIFLGLDSEVTNVQCKDAPVWFQHLISYNDEFPVIEKRGPVLCHGGVLHRTYYTQQGAVVVQEKYIQFIENDLKDEPLNLLLVDARGIPAVGVYRGFDLISLIMSIIDDGMITTYQQLVDMLHVANNQAKKEGSQSDESEE